MCVQDCAAEELGLAPGEGEQGVAAAAGRRGGALRFGHGAVLERRSVGGLLSLFCGDVVQAGDLMEEENSREGQSPLLCLL